jgi:replicative DNA helicase
MLGASIGPSVSDDTLTRSLTSLDAETGVLGAILLDASVLPRVRTVLEGTHFTTRAHANIYLGACDVYDAGSQVDSVSLAAYLEQQDELYACGGREYLDGLLDAVPTASAAEAHARLVRDRWERRAVVSTLRSLERAVVQGTVATREALQEAMRAATALEPGGDGFVQVRAALWDVMEGIEQRAKGGTAALLPTGFTEFDNHYGGLRPGELLMIAGNPGSGKSAVLNTIALHLAQCGHAVGIESCEMPRADVIERMLASVAGVDARALRRGTLTDDDWVRLARATGVLQALPLYVDDANTPTMTAMRATYDTLIQKHGPLAMLGVDFVQLLDLGRGSAAERVERLKMVAYGLKGLAKRPHPMAVVALAQLNNKDVVKRSDPRPRIEDIQGSSAFEQAADFVWLLHVDPAHPNQIIMDVAKGRGGGKTEFLLRADFARMRIHSW